MIAFRFTASYTAIRSEKHTTYFTSERKRQVSLLEITAILSLLSSSEKTDHAKSRAFSCKKYEEGEND